MAQHAHPPLALIPSPAPVTHTSRFRRALELLGPDFTLFFFFLTILVVIGRIFGAHYVVRLSTMLLPGLAAPGIILVKLIPRLGRVWSNAPGARADARAMARGTLRDWLP